LINQIAWICQRNDSGNSFRAHNDETQTYSPLVRALGNTSASVMRPACAHKLGIYNNSQKQIFAFANAVKIKKATSVTKWLFMF